MKNILTPSIVQHGWMVSSLWPPWPPLYPFPQNWLFVKVLTYVYQNIGFWGR